MKNVSSRFAYTYNLPGLLFQLNRAGTFFSLTLTCPPHFSVMDTFFSLNTRAWFSTFYTIAQWKIWFTMTHNSIK